MVLDSPLTFKEQSLIRQQKRFDKWKVFAIGSELIHKA